MSEVARKVTPAEMESVARLFHERQLGGGGAQLARLLHEQAEMSLLGGERSLNGRDEIIGSLMREPEGIYSATVTNCEQLSATVLLVSGLARFSRGKSVSFTSSPVYWLDEFRDGLLWQTREFGSESEARQALQPELLDDGDPGGREN